MYYVIFGDGEIWACDSLGRACEGLLDNDADDGFWEDEADNLKGKCDAFVIIKGEQVRVEQVWQAVKEAK